ncbi:MAG: S9 family peptidase [Gemmatimonadetes bacterium]|nr:S9 family peptidase [Gemmatimonadota bacterium]
MIPRSFVARVLFVLAAALLVPAPTAHAQQAAAKRPITHADYDSWRSISNPRLSRDGRFLVYTLVPQEADGELVLRNLTTGKETRSGIGTRPQPTGAVDEETGNPIPVSDVPPAFTSDGKYVVFQIRPSRQDADKAKKEKKKPEDQPKNAVGIMTVATGAVTRVERTKSFQVADDNPGFIAYLLEAKKDSAAPAARGRTKVDYGTDLVLRDLAAGTERTFPDVLEYSLSRDGKALVFVVSSRADQNNGAFSVNPSSPAPSVALLTGKGRYRKLTWDEKQTQAVFLADRGDSANTRTNYRLYRWDRQGQQAEELVSVATANFRSGMVISERSAIDFSQDGRAVYFGVAPTPEPERDSTADSGEDRVSVDLWHWKDDFIQPMQKVRAAQDRNRSYRAVYSRADRRLTQLADETMPTVNATADGRFAVGQDDRPYRTLVGVDANYADIYIVSTADGNRTRLIEKHQGAVTLSPTGKYGLYFRGKDWFIVSIADGGTKNLTTAIDASFVQEDFDSPSAAPSWGLSGWTRDEKYVLFNDRFDVWQVATDGSGAKNLTDGVGRKDKTIFRYARLEAPQPGEERGIDPAKPMLFAAVNEWTREEGFYRDRIDGGMPEKLIWAAKSFGGVTKAKDADVVILTQQSFNEFPDIQVTTSDFKALKKVTDANPQKAGLNWGNAELVRFKNVDGVQLSGMLIKPENFDPNKKYPMMVYIYEKLSQGLNRFVSPAPGTNINPAYYASNGYLVFQPDIVYTIGYPGQSALKCVLPAVQAVVDKGFVDENAIGIQGHSWGGYQIAYMTTQTKRFKAAAPGAVVVNMTSAYSGIRWGSGLPRQFQYEHTQSRIGGDIWEYPMRFIENSALFQLDRVQTPILTIHNDADDAVPWYQGIEYYLGLRRLGKEVYFFSYNGEPHGLRKRVNQKDYTVRLQQYFDHFLKGAPEPDWMLKGQPFLEKDKPKVTSDN